MINRYQIRRHWTLRKDSEDRTTGYSIIDLMDHVSIKEGVATFTPNHNKHYTKQYSSLEYRLVKEDVEMLNDKDGTNFMELNKKEVCQLEQLKDPW